MGMRFRLSTLVFDPLCSRQLNVLEHLSEKSHHHCSPLLCQTQLLPKHKKSSTKLQMRLWNLTAATYTPIQTIFDRYLRPPKPRSRLA